MAKGKDNIRAMKYSLDVSGTITLEEYKRREERARSVCPEGMHIITEEVLNDGRRGSRTVGD